METKQSAVEWLVSQVMYEYELDTDEEGDFLDTPKIALYNSFRECTDLSEFVEKARAMEKQQIIDAHVYGDENHTFNCMMREEYASDYYNETYGKTN